MNDRELIKQAIAEGSHFPLSHGRAYELADAVLAAIGDRLLPDLRGVTSMSAGWIPTMDDAPIRWEGTVDTPEILGAGRAIADTPADAIRVAYEGMRT